MLSVFGKLLIFLGIFLIILGILFSFAGKIPFLGKLPGDILIEKENFTFYFPLISSLILSILFSIIFYFISRFWK